MAASTAPAAEAAHSIELETLTQEFIARASRLLGAQGAAPVTDQAGEDLDEPAEPLVTRLRLIQHSAGELDAEAALEFLQSGFPAYLELGLAMVHELGCEDGCDAEAGEALLLELKDLVGACADALAGEDVQIETTSDRRSIGHIARLVVGMGRCRWEDHTTEAAITKRMGIDLVNWIEMPEERPEERPRA